MPMGYPMHLWWSLTLGTDAQARRAVFETAAIRETAIVKPTSIFMLT